MKDSINYLELFFPFSPCTNPATNVQLFAASVHHLSASRIGVCFPCRDLRLRGGGRVNPVWKGEREEINHKKDIDRMLSRLSRMEQNLHPNAVREYHPGREEITPYQVASPSHIPTCKADPQSLGQNNDHRTRRGWINCKFAIHLLQLSQPS